MRSKRRRLFYKRALQEQPWSVSLRYSPDQRRACRVPGVHAADAVSYGLPFISPAPSSQQSWYLLLDELCFRYFLFVISPHDLRPRKNKDRAIRDE